MTLTDHPAVRAALDASARIVDHTHLARVTSTNDVVREAVDAGHPPARLVTADRQTAGRGRAGRSWTDDVDGPDGPGNLAVSLAIAAPARAVGLVPLAAGLAVAAAYRDSGATPELKWPNDVLLGGAKAAGILVERHQFAGRDIVIIGCGLDLDWRGVPREQEMALWTSLAEHLDTPVDRGAVLGALVAALDRELDALDHPATLLDRYRERCVTIGREVRVDLPGGDRLAGRAVGIDAEGLLEVDTGRERVTVRAGDVALAGTR